MTKLIKRLNFPLFCVAISLLRLPPFYFLPIRHDILTSHNIARGLLLVLCAGVVFLIYFKKTRLIIDQRFAIILLFYFLTQSLSILGATNIEAFLLIYKNIVFSLLIFFVGIIILDSKGKLEKLVQIFIFTILLNIIYEFIIYFQHDVLFTFLKEFLYAKHWEGLKLNFYRARFFIDVYDEALIPFLFYFLYRQRKITHTIYLLILSSGVSFFSLVSNWRTKLVMLFFALISSFLIFAGRIKGLLIKFLVILFFLYTGYLISINNVGFNSLDRLLIPEQEDITTITKRVDMWSESINMALSSPLFGVGLGNYYDNLPAREIGTFSFYKWSFQLTQLTNNHPHNIFFGTLAETGFFGLLSFVLLILYFLITDVHLFKSSSLMARAAVVSFWTLFIFANLNVPTTFPYMALFWLLRAIILKST